MNIEPIPNVNIPNRIMEQIKENIFSGELKPGDKLPSERELAKMTGASRASIREAIRALEIIGVIKTVHGGGNFVNDTIEDNLSESLQLLYSLSGQSYEQIMELRRAVEMETAGLAARKATNEDILALKESFHNIETATDPAVAAEYDTRFHYQIAKASKNIFFVNVLRAVDSMMTSFILSARQNIIAGNHRPDITAHHTAILHAIENRNEDAARRAMKEHLAMIEEFYNQQ